MTFATDNEGSRGDKPLRPWIWGLAVALLLAPAVAMQFTTEVNWSLGDFLVFGAMLALACGAYELAARRSSRGTYRLAAGLAVGGAFLLIWANLAVGIIGNEDRPENLLFFGVIVVAVLGAGLARLEARGMARAMVATALAQVLASSVALWTGRSAEFVLASGFALLWLLSAYLFHRAAR